MVQCSVKKVQRKPRNREKKKGPWNTMERSEMLQMLWFCCRSVCASAAGKRSEAKQHSGLGGLDLALAAIKRSGLLPTPLLFFSFRPSWTSSTPAYGTLLPWGRPTRRPLPVSPLLFLSLAPSLIYFLSASRCRFRHSAKAALSLSLSPSLSVFHYSYLSPSPFVSAKKQDDIYPFSPKGLIVP